MSIPIYYGTKIWNTTEDSVIWNSGFTLKVFFKPSSNEHCKNLDHFIPKLWCIVTIYVRSSVFSISYFAVPPYLQDRASASKKVLRDIFLYQNIINSCTCLDASRCPISIIFSSSNDSTKSFSMSGGKETNCNNSEYLSHSAYFVIIDEINELVLTLLLSPSFSRSYQVFEEFELF